jgi:hypothetical protein
MSAKYTNGFDISVTSYTAHRHMSTSLQNYQEASASAAAAASETSEQIVQINLDGDTDVCLKAPSYMYNELAVIAQSMNELMVVK